MAPTLRNSTQRKTASSAKLAKDVGFKRKPRARNQRDKCTKGLVIWKKSKKLDAITTTNAATSPLLRLPAEIRTMIFKYAAALAWPAWINCSYDFRRIVSPTNMDHVKNMAIALPRVCRQVYAETATLIYSENRFAFFQEDAMSKWLGQRLVAQCEAIRWIVLPVLASLCSISASLDFQGFFKRAREIHLKYARRTCPNLVKVEEDESLDWPADHFGAFSDVSGSEF